MMVEQMQQIMKTQLESALNKLAIAEERPRKKARQHISEHSSNAKLCSICGEPGNGKDVHRHRELGVQLDGKCRKQVETFRHGGIIIERREEWQATLLKAAHSDLSQKMLASLGHSTSCQTSMSDTDLRIQDELSRSENSHMPMNAEKVKDEEAAIFSVLGDDLVDQICTDFSGLEDSWCLSPRFDSPEKPVDGILLPGTH